MKKSWEFKSFFSLVYLFVWNYFKYKEYEDKNNINMYKKWLEVNIYNYKGYRVGKNFIKWIL